MFDKEIFRGVSRQVWVKDLIVEEFEVYVSDLASAVLSLRIHHGASREEIVSARPGIPLPTEPNEGDGSVAGESVLNVIEVLEAPAPDHWYPLGGVSAKDIKSAQDSRVGLMIKFSLRPLLTGEDEAAPVPGPAIGGDAPIALFPGSSGASLSDLSSRNLVPVTENPPLGIIEFLVLEAKEMSPTGLNAKYADFYTRLIKVWGPTNQVEMARSEVVSKMLEPIWPPPERPWCVTISKFTKSRIALWNQNRMRPDDLYGYQEVGLPEGRSPEDLMEGGLGDLFGGVLSEEPDPIRGAGWFVLSVPLKKELLRGTNVFQMAKHKISVAARLLPIWLPDERMLPEPGTLAVLRLVIHQIQGVVNGRANLFVEIVDSERLLARSSLRLNARDPLWNETFDTFVGAIRMDKPVTIAVKKAIGSSYNRASRISSLTTSVGELLVGLTLLVAYLFTDTARCRIRWPSLPSGTRWTWV